MGGQPESVVRCLYPSEGQPHRVGKAGQSTRNRFGTVGTSPAANLMHGARNGKWEQGV